MLRRKFPDVRRMIDDPPSELGHNIRVQYDKYKHSEKGDARFPGYFNYESIGVSGSGRPFRLRYEVELSNLTVNGEISSSVFKALSGAVKY